MSSDISLTTGSWYGTQMKPDLFDPATAEWAGRVAEDAAWLFARQGQTIFVEGLNEGFTVVYDLYHTPSTGEVVLLRDFWLNESAGTLVHRFQINFDGAYTDLVVFAATLWVGKGGGWRRIGTTDWATTTSSAPTPVTITMNLDPDWYYTNVFDYARYSLQMRAQGVEDHTNAVDFVYNRLYTNPRT